MSTITREDAWNLLRKYNKEQFHLRHALTVEGVMKYFAEKLGYEDEKDFWAMVGLLHDLDEEQCNWQEHPEVHGKTSVEILEKEGVNDQVLFDAICAHNPASGVKPQTKLQRAVYAADPMSGFCNAIALCYPDKKIASVKVKSVVKRIPEKRFAAGANREAMLSIENLGIEFEEFAQIALESMCKISNELGL